MSTYRLSLDVDLTHRVTDDLVERLAELGEATSDEPTPNRVRLILVGEGSTAADALANATRRTLEVVNNGGDGPGEVTAAEVVTPAEADRRRSDSTFPEIVGIAEIADLLGITRQRASALQTRDGFPAPVAQLRSGPVWLLSDLSNFARTWDHTPGRPSESSAARPAPVDVDQLIATANNFIPSPLARNALKLVRWYGKRPKS